MFCIGSSSSSSSSVQAEQFSEQIVFLDTESNLKSKQRKEHQTCTNLKKASPTIREKPNLYVFLI